jgi:hypothetical protein
MNHNGGFPPIFEGGKKEVVQREFNAQNVLSLNQILTNNKTNKIIIRREEPIIYNVVDNKPNFKKTK